MLILCPWLGKWLVFSETLVLPPLDPAVNVLPAAKMMQFFSCVQVVPAQIDAGLVELYISSTKSTGGIQSEPDLHVTAPVMPLPLSDSFPHIAGGVSVQNTKCLSTAGIA